MSSRAAKYYIYRNLHKGGFSIRHRGKVIAVTDDIVAFRVVFKVSEAGRQRVIADKAKNVHAYAVCDLWARVNDAERVTSNMLRVRYNPYTDEGFMVDGKKLISCAELYFHAGKCYIFNMPTYPLPF